MIEPRNNKSNREADIVKYMESKTTVNGNSKDAGAPAGSKSQPCYTMIMR